MSGGGAFLEALLWRTGPDLAFPTQTMWADPRPHHHPASGQQQKARSMSQEFYLNPAGRNPSSESWLAESGADCACLSFPFQGRSLVFKVGDSQSQETSQTSELCSDAEGPANRKQTFTVSLSSSVSSRYLPLMLRGVGSWPKVQPGQRQGIVHQGHFFLFVFTV